MTCIVAVRRGRSVAMATDSVAVSGWDVVTRSALKMDRVDLGHSTPAIVGSTGTMRGMVSLSGFSAPEAGVRGADLLVAWAEAARKRWDLVVDRNVGKVEETWLIATKFGIFRMATDFSITPGMRSRGWEIAAVGCGSSYALGSCFESIRREARHGVSPITVAARAVEAAIQFSAGVGGRIRSEHL